MRLVRRRFHSPMTSQIASTTSGLLLIPSRATRERPRPQALHRLALRRLFWSSTISRPVWQVLHKASRSAPQAQEQLAVWSFQPQRDLPPPAAPTAQVSILARVEEAARST